MKTYEVTFPVVVDKTFRFKASSPWKALGQGWGKLERHLSKATHRRCGWKYGLSPDVSEEGVDVSLDFDEVQRLEFQHDMAHQKPNFVLEKWIRVKPPADFADWWDDVPHDIKEDYYRLQES